MCNIYTLHSRLSPLDSVLPPLVFHLRCLIARKFRMPRRGGHLNINYPRCSCLMYVCTYRVDACARFRIGKPKGYALVYTAFTSLGYMEERERDPLCIIHIIRFSFSAISVLPRTDVGAAGIFPIIEFCNHNTAPT